MDAGSRFGSYTLIARIGAGGMGEVWKAEDPRLRRTVAIKILPPDSAGSEESNARFIREARTAAQLNHPNIATIHSIEEHDGRLFIVMEYVEGEPLSRLIRSGRLSEAEIAFIGKGIAEALAEAHANGIIHRDIKPDNVILSGRRVKVLDFGIAKKLAPETERPGVDGLPTDFHTQRGVILGTVHYMSPEQAMGKPLDARTDVFSLGVLLYEAATGILPFRGETVTDTLTRIIRDDAPDLRVSHPRLSRPLADVIMKCLAKDREARFGNAGEIAAALDESLSRSRTEDQETADLPTAISVSDEKVSAAQTAPESEVRDAPTVVAGGHGPWPWIFATVLLVMLSVAGTAWYVTKVLRPEPPEREPARLAPPPAEAAASAEVDVQPVDSGQESDKTGTSAAEEAAGADVEQPAAPPDRPGAPGSREIPPEASADAAPSEQAEALARRGYWLIGRGREGEGIESLRRAVELDPARAHVWIPIGVAALRRGRNEDAARAFDAALRRETSLRPREVELAAFGKAVAEGDTASMSEHCRTAPFDREFAELRRLANAAGAECGPPRRGPGPPAGQPEPRP